MLISRCILNSNKNGQNLIRVPVKYKPHHGKTIIYENKSGYCAAEHHLCFRYTDRTIPLFPTFAISSLHPSYVAVQSGFCRTWSETPKTDFLKTLFILYRSSTSLSESCNGVFCAPKFHWHYSFTVFNYIQFSSISTFVFLK